MGISIKGSILPLFHVHYGCDHICAREIKTWNPCFSNPWVKSWMWTKGQQEGGSPLVWPHLRFLRTSWGTLTKPVTRMTSLGQDSFHCSLLACIYYGHTSCQNDPNPKPISNYPRTWPLHYVLPINSFTVWNVKNEVWRTHMYNRSQDFPPFAPNTWWRLAQSIGGCRAS